MHFMQHGAGGPWDPCFLESNVGLQCCVNNQAFVNMGLLAAKCGIDSGMLFPAQLVAGQ